jgi:RimJ/RimL family protein N-acetyltransferase
MATADGRNIASIKLLQRLGFQQEKQETVWFKGQRVRENSYMLTKEKWEKHI